jgi:hypothetical protein
MASMTEMIERLRGVNLERLLGLRPEYPRVALDLERSSLALVRLKKRRHGRPQIGGYHVQPTDDAAVPATIFDQESVEPARLSELLRALFEASGIRPGKVSVVLPDNLAKLSLLTLPERPPSRRQLEEVIRFKVRRGVPFRISDAIMSYQLLPGEGKGIVVLVALIHRALVERYEQALESIGARPGLIDLCTPNLLNLCRERIDTASAEGDAALLNCAGCYFSLAIVRRGRLIFLRCKTYSMGNGQPGPIDGVLARELGYSLSYYEEKLAGEGIRTLFVRSLDQPFDRLEPHLASLDADELELIDPVARVDPGETGEVDPEVAQRLAPALGAVLRRT